MVWSVMSGVDGWRPVSWGPMEEGDCGGIVGGTRVRWKMVLRSANDMT
jgi:hypothetical protein